MNTVISSNNLPKFKKFLTACTSIHVYHISFLLFVWLWVERLNCNGVDWKDTTDPQQLPTMNCWLGVSHIHFCIWDSLVPGLGMRRHLGYSGITLSKHLLGSNHCYCDSTALTQGHLLLSKMQEREAKPTNPWHNELIELLSQRK